MKTFNIIIRNILEIKFEKLNVWLIHIEYIKQFKKKCYKYTEETKHVFVHENLADIRFCLTAMIFI